MASKLKINPVTGKLDLVEITEPAGSNNEIQFNDNGEFGGFGNWDGSILTIPSILIDNPTETNVPIIIRGAPSQSANLTEWQDSLGNNLLDIDSNGDIDMNANNIYNAKRLVFDGIDTTESDSFSMRAIYSGGSNYTGLTLRPEITNGANVAYGFFSGPKIINANVNWVVGAAFINANTGSGGTVTDQWGIKMFDMTSGTNSNTAIETGLGTVKFGDDLYITKDNKALYLGTSQDMSVYYDGTGGWIDTSEVAPSDLNINCGIDKTLELQEGVYMDENFNPITGRGASAPDLINLDTTNIKIAAFNGSATLEEVHAHKELNHNYKLGTDLHFHLHFAPTTVNTGNIKWFIEYHITDGFGATIKATGTLSTVVAVNGIAWETLIADLGAVVDNGFDIGDQVSLRLYRDPSDVEDTYPDDAVVKTYGYHYEIDTLGSRQLFTK